MKSENSPHFRSCSVVDIPASKGVNEMTQIDNNDGILSNANAGSVPQLDSQILQNSFSSSVGEQSQFGNSEDERGKFFCIVSFITSHIEQETYEIFKIRLLMLDIKYFCVQVIKQPNLL